MITSYYCTAETKAFFHILTAKAIPSASFCLKINLVTLTGQKKTGAEIKEEADLFVEHLSHRLEGYRNPHPGQGSPKKKKSSTSSTSVPFFDISYQNVIEAFEGRKLDSDLDLATLEEFLPLLKDMFGLGCIKKSICEIKNESVVPLGNSSSPR